MVLTNFQERALFGTLYAGTVVVGILSGPAALLCIAITVLFACWKEYSAMNNLGTLGTWGISLINLFYFGASFAGSNYIPSHTIMAITALLFLILVTILLFARGIIAIHEMKTILSGCLYISLPIFLFILLPQMGNLTPADHLNYWNWQQHLGWPWGDKSSLIPQSSIHFTSQLPQYHWQYPLAVFVLIWSSDTFAYLVGKSIGKNPLHALLSPKKTWEGFIGGTILTAGVACLLFHYWDLGDLTTAALLGASFSIFGTAGDLFESALKRDKDLKDSGNFIPGHGGALDRFDAFLFGCVVFWAWLNFAG